MRKIALISLATLALLPLDAQAKSDPFTNNDSAFLIESCREAVEIYQKRDQQNLLAGIATSMSEALRAGFCIGVVQQHINSSDNCYGTDWLEAASTIAALSVTTRWNTRKRLLQEAVCDD